MLTLTKWKYTLGVLLITLSLSVQAQTAGVSISPTGPIICSGTKLDAVVTGLSAPITYAWSNGAVTPSIFATQTGFYRVRVTGVDAGGATVTVTSAWAPYLVIPNPNASITPAGPVNLCPGQSVQLGAAGGFFFSSYQWNTGATTRNITVNQTGDYTVTISHNFGGCSASSSALKHVNVVDSGFQPTINADGPITICKPGYVNLFADSGFSSYLWSTGATTQSVSILLDGTQAPILDTLAVTLTVSLNGQCSFTNTDGLVIRSIREPKLGTRYCGNFGLTTADSMRSELVLSYGSFIPQYEFEFEETTHPGVLWTYVSNSRWCPLSAVTPAIQANKFYNVRVRAIIGGIPYCYGSFCQIGIVPANPIAQPNQSAFRIAGSTVDANVFPNPSSEDFQLVVRSENNDQPAVVQISDLSGRIVNEFTYDANAGSSRFGADLNNGVYMVTVTQGDNRSVTRIIKSN